MRRIGIDVGGTNTDAVLLDGGRVLRSIKVATTYDITSGILRALESLAGKGAHALDAVMIGTTHFINAVIERRSLAPVAALRIGTPISASLPPFCDWPHALALIVNGGVWSVSGGFEYDGRPINALDEDAVAQAAYEMRGRGLRAVGICGIFSPIDASQERRAAEIVEAIVPDAVITCSCDLGRIGLLERENATLLNAALSGLAASTVSAFSAALEASGLSAPLFITQNDGTVAAAADAERFPIYSFASGATNSMRGAAFLSGIEDALVVDVGGTSTDVGELVRGFPRQSNSIVEIGGVRTLFRMPALHSFGLGGGSIITSEPFSVGPNSVGFRLNTLSKIFGGDTLTTSDVAVAEGLLCLGDVNAVQDLPHEMCLRVLAHCQMLIEEALDRAKTQAGDVSVIAVGGGAFLVPDSIAGAREVQRVQHGDCANAVGAAIAQISGEVDQVFRETTRERAIESATETAKARAIAAGASQSTLAVIECEDMPLAYLPGNSLRVRVRVVGDISTQLPGSRCEHEKRRGLGI